MNILLINPNYRSEFYKERVNITAPINLMYLAQVLLNNGFSCKIIDSYADNLLKEDLVKIIRIKKPKYLLFPLYSLTLKEIYDITKYLKDKFPDIEIILGGLHTTSMPQKVLEEFKHINYIIKGEAENMIVSLIEILDSDKITIVKNLKKQKGISYRVGNKIFHNQLAGEIKDLNKIPIPSRKLIDIKKYKTNLTNANPSDVIITSRGCIYKCSFCDKLTEGFRKYRERNSENIIEELRMIQDNGAKSVEVFDELFILNKIKTLRTLKMMRKEGIDLEFRIRTRVDTINNKILSELARNNCHTISFGVESGSQKILNNINKGINIQMAIDAFKLTKKHKIGTLGFFIIGHINDTKETIKQTITLAKKLNPDYATFSKLIPFPGTPAYIEAIKKKMLRNEYSINKDIPYVHLPWMKTEAELDKIVSDAYSSFYKRPSYVIKSLKRTIKKGYYNQLWFMAKNFYKDIKKVSVQ